MSRRILVIGNFDGVHLGHQALFNQAVNQLDSQAGDVLHVVTFEPHPRQVLAKDSSFCRLLLPEVKLRFLTDYLNQLSIPWLIQEIRFDASVSQLTYDQFLNGLLKTYSGVVGLVVGYNFALGRDKKGDISTIQKWCHQVGLNLSVISPVLDPSGQPIHTSRIKTKLQERDLSYVASALGRYYMLAGWVTPGMQLASRMGYPTINVQIRANICLPAGVYLIRSEHEGGKGWGLMHWGPKPTLNINDWYCECHFLETQGESFFSTTFWWIEALSFIREVKKFDTLSLLQAQIKQDVDKAYEIWRSFSFSR